MRLRAPVRKLTGRTTHLHGEFASGKFEVTSAAIAKSVEIIEQDGAIYLLRIDEHGECTADTWHETVDAAKTQARFEFGIENDDWEEAQPRQ